MLVVCETGCHRIRLLSRISCQPVARKRKEHTHKTAQLSLCLCLAKFKKKKTFVSLFTTRERKRNAFFFFALRLLFGKMDSHHQHVGRTHTQVDVRRSIKHFFFWVFCFMMPTQQIKGVMDMSFSFNFCFFSNRTQSVSAEG